MTLTPVPGTPYQYDSQLDPELNQLRDRVRHMREKGTLSPGNLKRLRNYFRTKNIYHSNAIEGNSLNIGETRLVVEQGLTITGKPLKDSIEAKNLSSALDYFEQLADRESEPIREVDIRSIHAAILKDINDENAGKYRTMPVKIAGSDYQPPNPENVPPMMAEFARWLGEITNVKLHHPVDPLILACVAHVWFVYIHPFIDGNGRTARLLMNLVLIRYGYPLAIITREDRLRYYEALQEAEGSDLTPFIRLVYESVLEAAEEYEQALKEQQADQEWAQSLVSAFTRPEENRLRNQYDLWNNAMRLLKSHFRQRVDLLNEVAELENRGGLVNIFFREYGTLDFEKYLSLKRGESAKQTWFFRLDFRRGQTIERFLFFFGYTSPEIKHELGQTDVSLHTATELEFQRFKRLKDLPEEQRSNFPELYEIGYVPQKEQFIYLVDQSVRYEKIEKIGDEFIAQVIDRRF